jgi:saccharopine dehydrogenase-like NADP-dependent oxidoreductase
MANILIIGAGRSATSLIHYLLQHAVEYNWQITVADQDLALAESKIEGFSNATATTFNAKDPEQRELFISKADLVVSMLPAFLHIHVAKDCLRLDKNLATASYVSEALKEMHEEVKAKGLTFLNEIGLDPGIDHMSAVQMINKIRAKGGNINAFYSFTGGLIAPECDNNPWHYKFTWNPRNVVLAGQGTAKFLFKNRYRHIPYSRLFVNVDRIEVPGLGTYEWYPNRTSLTYREAYGLEDIPTILRGTLRHQGFSAAWNLLVQLGLTDDTYVMSYADDLTYREWVRSYLPSRIEKLNISLREQLAILFRIDVNAVELEQLEWLGLFEEINIPLDEATPAQVLQHLLESKWTLEPEDKDMIVMQHEIEYTLNERQYKHTSSLVHIGKNAEDTAMAELVGLPLAIGVKHMLLGNITAPGVIIPITPEIYNPVMEELATIGVRFSEVETELTQNS